MISWGTVCKPKSHGGLGVVDIQLHNKTLLIKNLYKFFNKQNLPWVNLLWESYYTTNPPQGKVEGSFWWKAHLKLIPLFKEVAHSTVGTGETTLFWTDNWHENPLAHQYPELHSFVIDGQCSVAHMKQSLDIMQQFHTPLSSIAFQQLNDITPILQHLGNSNDSWK